VAKLIVLTHGRLAEELVQAAIKIVGPLDNVAAVSIGWDDDVPDARTLIEQARRGLGDDGGLLILTDMFGGTPTNLALSLLEPGKVEVVTGVNLPMVIKFTNLRGSMSLDEIARRITAQGREAIQTASAILDGTSGQGVEGEA
jgi:PTS system mannose-specific IIA component